MSAITGTMSRNHGILGFAACAAMILVLCGCHKALSGAGEPPAVASGEKAEKPEKAEQGEAGEEGLSLKPEEIEKMGIATEEAREITSAQEVSGFGVVLAHETVAQAVAELRTALAAARQSKSAFERTHRLAGTPGAMPVDTQETAERQAAADEAALQLARQRLSSTFGQSPPWRNAENSPELLALASGQSKLVHVTFPLGSIDEATPTSVRLTLIGAGQGGRSWQSRFLWRAPADASVPGKSFFAILKDTDASEGDHLLAWAPVGTPESGVLVPASAAVVSAGKFWCYIEKEPGTFVRMELDPSRPTPDGYFVKEGIGAGDKIVIASAGQLLARETNASTEPE